MTELLEKAIEKAHSMPPDIQDAIARLVLSYTGDEQPVASPMPERGRQAHAVDLGKINAITRRSASRPLLDTRSAREILDEAWGEPA